MFRLCVRYFSSLNSLHRSNEYHNTHDILGVYETKYLENIFIDLKFPTNF